MKFLKIDTWDFSNDWVDIYVGDIMRERIKSTVQDGNTHYCGTVSSGFMGSQSNNERLFSLSYDINPYATSSVEVKFISNFDETEYNESWGVREIFINLKLCDTSCLSCNGASSSNCQTCHVNANLAGGICTCRDYYYLKDVAAVCSSNPCAVCTRCHISCKTCSGPSSSNCLSCESQDGFSNTAKTCTYASSN